MIGCTPNHSGLYTMIKKEYERNVLRLENMNVMYYDWKIQ